MLRPVVAGYVLLAATAPFCASRMGVLGRAASGVSTQAYNKFIGIAYSGNGTFVAILNTGNDGPNTYIGADKGTLYKISGGTATLLRTGMSTKLGGIGASASGKIVTAGSGGVVYGNPIVPQAQQITLPVARRSADHQSGWTFCFSILRSAGELPGW